MGSKRKILRKAHHVSRVITGDVRRSGISAGALEWLRNTYDYSEPPSDQRGVELPSDNRRLRARATSLEADLGHRAGVVAWHAAVNFIRRPGV